jgi:hypothetical protein
VSRRKPTKSTALPPLSPFFRSRAGNDIGQLSGVDGRSMIARRYKELCIDLSDHLGGDPTSTEIALLRRCAALQAWCEKAESDFANTGDIEIQQYTSATNTLRRLVNDLGLQRVTRDVTLDLSDYLEAVANA